MRQLTSLDAQFLALETDTTYGHVGGLAIFDASTAPEGRLTLADVKRLHVERLHLLPPLRWKLVDVPLGLVRPYWIDDPDFDLDYHVREIALPEPGDDEQLATQVARIFSRPLDRTRPLWELYVIQGVRGGGHVATMSKIHHAMVDGMSGAEIMGVLFDLAPEGREIPPAPEGVSAGDPPGGVAMLGRGVVGVPGQVVSTVRSLASTLPHIDVLPSALGIPGATTASRTLSRARNLVARNRDGQILERPVLGAPRVPFSGRIGRHRVFAFGSVDLDRVKTIKNQLGVTVNDVVVALCAGAVREWLIAHDALPDKPVVAQVPVSVRTEEQRGTFGNRVSIMLVPIPTDESDPVQRVMRAHEVLRGAKERHHATPADLLQDATNFIPPALHARATRVAFELGARGRPLYNLVISNVPGPPVPLYLGGAELQANYPISVITDGAGLNITVLSYRGHMDFGIIADRDQMPDVDRVLDALRGGLDELEATCAGSGAGAGAGSP